MYVRMCIVVVSHSCHSYHTLPYGYDQTYRVNPMDATTYASCNNLPSSDPQQDAAATFTENQIELMDWGVGVLEVLDNTSRDLTASDTDEKRVSTNAIIHKLA